MAECRIQNAELRTIGTADGSMQNAQLGTMVTGTGLLRVPRARIVPHARIVPRARITLAMTGIGSTRCVVSIAMTR